EPGTGPHQVGVYSGARIPADRHDALFTAFAAEPHRRDFGVGVRVGAQPGDVVHVQADDFGDPRPRAVQQFYEGAVPQCARTASDVGCGEQRLHLGHGDGFGESALEGGGPYLVGGVVGGESFAEREPVQAADCDHGSSRGVGAQRPVVGVAFPQGAQEGGDVVGADVAQAGDAAGGEEVQVAVEVPDR